MTAAKTATVDYVEIQRDLEIEMKDLGFKAYTDRLVERATTGSIPEKAALALTEAVFQKVYRKLEDHIDTQKMQRGGLRGFAKIFLELDRYTVAYLAVVQAVAILGGKNTKRTTFEATIGEAINVYYKTATGSSFDKKTSHSVGATLFGILEQCNLLGSKTVGKAQKSYVDAFPGELIKKLAEAGMLGAGGAKAFPMVVPPKPWTNLTNGGYLTISNRFVRRAGPTQSRLLEENKPLAVMASVNKVQNVAWTVDTQVLGFVKELVAADLDEDKLKYEAGVTEGNMKDALKTLAKLGKLGGGKGDESRFVRTAAAIAVADRFAEFPSIWFPHNVDNRGRQYPISDSLSPQGGSLDKALLSFAKGQYLTAEGERWWSYHLANTYGHDKAAPLFRFGWAKNNAELIARVAADPMANLKDWLGADDALGFLKACLAWADHKAGRSVHISVSLDATCSGIQLWSALLKDADGAQSVNLSDTDTRHDFYTEVLDAVVANLNADESDEAKLVLKYVADITRTVVKPPSMNYSYGIKIKGAAEALAKELNGSPLAEDYKTLFWFASYLLKTIGTVIKSSADGMAWLKTCVKASGLTPVSYVTPSGFTFVQESFKKIKARGFTVVVDGTGVIRPSFLLESDIRDTAKDSSSIAPNCIHSLDASLLALVTNAFEADAPLMVVHDSFGTLPNEAGVLQQLILGTFEEMFKGDLLGDIHSQLTADAKVEVKKPTVGTWKSSDMRNNVYAFS